MHLGSLGIDFDKTLVFPLFLCMEEQTYASELGGDATGATAQLTNAPNANASNNRTHRTHSIFAQRPTHRTHSIFAQRPTHRTHSNFYSCPSLIRPAYNEPCVSAWGDGGGDRSLANLPAFNIMSIWAVHGKN